MFNHFLSVLMFKNIKQLIMYCIYITVHVQYYKLVWLDFRLDFRLDVRPDLRPNVRLYTATVRREQFNA